MHNYTTTQRNNIILFMNYKNGMNLEQGSRDTGIGEAHKNELFKKFCAVLTYLSSRIYRYLGLKKFKVHIQ